MSNDKTTPSTIEPVPVPKGRLYVLAILCLALVGCIFVEFGPRSVTWELGKRSPLDSPVLWLLLLSPVISVALAGLAALHLGSSPAIQVKPIGAGLISAVIAGLAGAWLSIIVIKAISNWARFEGRAYALLPLLLVVVGLGGAFLSRRGAALGVHCVMTSVLHSLAFYLLTFLHTGLGLTGPIAFAFTIHLLAIAVAVSATIPYRRQLGRRREFERAMALQERA